MKTKFFMFALFAAMSLGGHAQNDDMYFVPTKKQKKAEKEAVERERERERLYLEGLREECDERVPGERDVDEYNRRGKAGKESVVLTDSAGMQWTLHVDENGETVWMPLEEEAGETRADARDYRDDYADGDDFTCTRLLTRYHGYYAPVYYAGWYDPWFYDSWYYDPWYYTGWYGPGWHAHVHWGWGWSWGPGWWGGWYPVYPSHPSYGWSGRRGSSFGHVGGGALAQGSRRGGSTLGNFNSTTRRGSSFVAPRGVTSRGAGRSGSVGTGRTPSRGTVSTGTSRGSRRAGTTTSRPATGRSRSTSAGPSRSTSPSRSMGGNSGAGRSGGFSGGGRSGGGFSGGGGRGRR